MTKLSGVVADQSGAPARDAVVELHNESGDVVDQIAVDDDARYRYHLSPGTWSLRVWDARGGRAEASVTLSAGEDKTLDITLSR